MHAKVQVFLKENVLDPQGQAIQKALQSTGYGQVSSVKAGKTFLLELNETDKDRARQAVDEISRKVLSNPIIEDFQVVSLD